MNRVYTVYITLFTIVVALYCSCSGVGPIAGGSSQQGNGILIGRVVDSLGEAAARVSVSLLPSDYNTVKDTVFRNFTDTTDAEGNYRFNNIVSGKYSILARNRKMVTSFLERDITIIDDSIMTAPVATLKKSGSIVTNFSSGEATEGSYLYIPGTDISSQIGSGSSVSLTDVPPGTFTELMLVSNDKEKENILRNDIIVSAGDTTIVQLPFWKYSHRIVLNTTANGANVAENVYDFPLLIRLNSENFNFTQSQNSGQDIRFMKMDGTILSHEIERWNTAEKQAVIWVKIDTVFGNSNHQAFTMYWGNTTAVQASEGAVIFDTALGFKAVFHLDDTLKLYDASMNLSGGTNSGAMSVQGAIGGALKFVNEQETSISFPHKDNLDAVSLLESPNGCTFSWWMFPYEDLDTISSNERRTIIAKGADWGGDYDQDWAIFIWSDSLVLQGYSLYWAHVKTSITSWEPYTWYYITISYNGKTAQWFVNGEPFGPEIAFDYEFQSSDDKAEISVGRLKGASSKKVFDGILDEIRITNMQQSVGWIKLCYMNQRTDNKLVMFE